MAYGQPAGGQAPPAAFRNQWKHLGLWTLQIGLAVMFFAAGGSKLAGASDMIALFDAVGLGQWFRYLTGGLEVLSAVLLVVPALAALGAAILVLVMTGAVLTHLFVIGGSPALPLTLLVAAAVVAWGRKARIAAMQSGRPIGA